MLSRRAKLVVSGVVTLVLVAAVPALAQPHREITSLTTPGTERVLTLPPAADGAPVISLGTALDPGTGKQVEGIAFIHYKRGFHHRPNHEDGGKPDGGTADSSTCYSHLAKGARWKQVEPWVLNPANNEGLAADFLLANAAANLQKWEDAAGNNIFGGGSTTTDPLLADTATPDGQNEVYFGDIADSNAIAVTIVWGIFGGPPGGRQLVEWDQVYDEVDFAWSDNGDANRMDFENISTHENGHAAGMGHPSDACTEETMYRFASEGETKKRSLEAGDVAGISALY